MPISMFVKKSNRIKIVVYVYEEEGHVEATEAKHEIPRDIEHEEVTFFFRRPNYADSNLILRQFVGGADVENVDISSLQDVAMHNLLVDWDLKDDDGKKISINRANIDTLQPAVGRAAAVGFLSQIRF